MIFCRMHSPHPSTNGETRDLLNDRYDEPRSGNVEPVDGEEAFARLKAKITILRGRD
jgi:hypothetical protein